MKQSRENTGTDVYSSEKRSQVMARVKSGNTKPELAVRSVLHGMGYRFRLHRKDLPGRPDIVLPKYKTVVFVHGCFWHQHPGCKKATIPKQNAEFWEAKLSRNRERDERNLRELDNMGWKTIVVWECEVRDTEKLIGKLLNALPQRTDESIS